VEPPVALQVRGPEKLAAAGAIRGANLETCQLDTQCAGFSQVARVICPQTCLDLATLGPTMLFTGAMPQQHYTLVFAIAGNKGGTEIAGIETGYNFKRATEHFEGYMNVFAPGGAVDAITASGYTGAALTVPVEVFHSLLARAFPEVPATILTTGAAMRTGAAERIRLRSLIAAVEAAIRQPDLLAGLLARRHLERDLLDGFLAALRSGCQGRVPAPPRSRVAGRLRKLRQARDYVAAHVAEPISLDELCAAVGLSHRGMENLFQDYLGLGPIAYLRRHRLQIARRALLNAAFAPGVVKQVALECGFWHFGHFAYHYRSLFGESPHATISRPEYGPHT
jgi:AraC-like DNA-binding protein